MLVDHKYTKKGNLQNCNDERINFLAINLVVLVGAGQYTFLCTFPPLNRHVLH